MRYIIPVFPRSGSIWLEEVVRLATGLPTFPIDFNYERIPGILLSEQEVEVFNELPPGIYRSHHLAPCDCLPLLDADGFKLLTLRRNLQDTLVSLILSNRDKVQKHPTIARFNKTWSFLDDASFVNLFIEANLPHVNTEIRRWTIFQKEVWSDKSYISTYERWCADIQKELAGLFKFIGFHPDAGRFHHIIAETTPDKLKERLVDPSHIHFAQPGIGRGLLDHQSIDRIENHKQLLATL